MRRILVVDDYSGARQVLQDRLEMQGYTCRGAEDGAEALKILQTQRFDLVITDNEMPIMTGLQLLQCLAEWPVAERPLCILVTGKPSKSLRKAAKKAGACALFKKPYNFQEIDSSIIQILGDKAHDDRNSLIHECSSLRE